jgi:hypothetical protein
MRPAGLNILLGRGDFSAVGQFPVCRLTDRNAPNQRANHLIMSFTFVPSGVFAICL